MIDLEKSGTLLLSGPLCDEACAMTGEGITTMRAATFEDAMTIAGRGPLMIEG